MNYQKIYSFDLANGPGIRVSFFVSGCTLHCPDCFNPEAQDFNSGLLANGKEYFAICEILKNPYYQGLSILGGEPFDQDEEGINYLCNLCQAAHILHKDVWVWSGYTKEQIESDTLKTKLLSNCDVLVDGPFINSQKDRELLFRGSANQRIIYLNNKFDYD